MRDLVRAVERRALVELDVEVDVAAAAGPPRAQLVVAGDLRRAVVDFERLAHRRELVLGEHLVDEHPRRAHQDAQPRGDDRDRDGANRPC